MIKFDNESILVGSKKISTIPIKPFETSVINFLDNISKEIQRDPNKEFNSEIKTFGFFCRKRIFKN